LRSRFCAAMRWICAAMLLLVLGCAGAAEEPRVLSEVKPLPLAPDPNFEFRKTKIYTLSSQAPKAKSAAKSPSAFSLSGKSGAQSSAVTQDVSLNFERSYRMFGAVTALDQRQRFGQYFDFFWRAKQPSDVTVRFEYKQEKLRAFTQAKELSYRGAHGTRRSEFRVTGDEFMDDGKVLAWRCLLIAHGRIVAEKRSFLWD
jgi:hypothetical protein